MTTATVAFKSLLLKKKKKKKKNQPKKKKKTKTTKKQKNKKQKTKKKKKKKKKKKTQPNLENIFIPYIKKAVPFFDSSFPPLFKTYLFQSPGT